MAAPQLKKRGSQRHKIIRLAMLTAGATYGIAKFQAALSLKRKPVE